MKKEIREILMLLALICIFLCLGELADRFILPYRASFFLSGWFAYIVFNLIKEKD